MTVLVFGGAAYLGLCVPGGDPGNRVRMRALSEQHTLCLCLLGAVSYTHLDVYKRQHVRRPVAAVIAAARQAVVGQAARPHHLCAGVQVLRIGMQDLRFRDDRAHQRLGHAVGDLHAAAVGEVALHGMHEDIRAAAAGLIVRQGERELRIHAVSYTHLSQPDAGSL